MKQKIYYFCFYHASFSEKQLINIHNMKEDMTNKLKQTRHQICEIIIHDPHLHMHIFHQA